MSQSSTVVMVLTVLGPEWAPASKDRYDEECPSRDLAALASDMGLLWGRRCKIWLRRTRGSLWFVFRDNAVSSLVWTFLLFEIGVQSKQVLLQYALKRYNWTLARVSQATEAFYKDHDSVRHVGSRKCQYDQPY